MNGIHGNIYLPSVHPTACTLNARIHKLGNPINQLPIITMQDTHLLVVYHTPSWLTHSPYKVSLTEGLILWGLSVLPTIPTCKACRPNNPSMQNSLWCGTQKLWCGYKLHLHHALVSCLEFCLGRTLGLTQELTTHTWLYIHYMHVRYLNFLECR